MLLSLSLSVFTVWEQKGKTMGLCTETHEGNCLLPGGLEKKRLQKEEKETFGPKFPPVTLFPSRLTISVCSYKVERWWLGPQASSEPLLSPGHSEHFLNVCWMNGLSENLSGSGS